MKPFPPHSAARNLTKSVPTATPEETVAEVLKRLRENAHTFETISYTYILSHAGKLRGVVAIKSLLKAQDQQTMKEIMTPDPIAVHPYTDQEKAAIFAIQHNIKAIPVIDKDRNFQGIIPTDRILDILHDEHIEDILKLSGLDVSVLQLSEKRLQHASASLRMRLPWLLLGLVGGLVSTWIVSRFSYTIQQLISLAFFIPIITYMSGAIASQTLSMLIRNLLITGLDIRKYLVVELTTGTFLGGMFGLLIAAVAYIWLGSLEVAAIIAITMTVNAFVSTAISTVVPWTLTKFNKDPALAAGPFAIVLQDIVSLLVYFTTAAAVLQIT
ncbi:magnesium transporter [Patescibacteria group bacterium]|nr:magnesium transporter [Patescibacteria group bacterium]